MKGWRTGPRRAVFPHQHPSLSLLLQPHHRDRGGTADENERSTPPTHTYTLTHTPHTLLHPHLLSSPPLFDSGLTSDSVVWLPGVCVCLKWQLANLSFCVCVCDYPVVPRLGWPCSPGRWCRLPGRWCPWWHLGYRVWNQSLLPGQQTKTERHYYCLYFGRCVCPCAHSDACTR